MIIRESLKNVYRLLNQVRLRYLADGCSHSAAALTYMSLFALVPLLTVMYAILSAIPAFQEVGLQVQQTVFENFVPTTGQEVQNYLNDFAQQARTLTGIGVVFLGVTAILMMRNIEKTFNAIWKTRENRKGLSSFLLYWAILSLGPICVGLALGINTYLVSLKVMFDQVDIIGIGPQLLRLTPYFLTSVAFTLMYIAVPNCRVPFKHALIGGLVTALVFEIAKQLFAGIVANTSYQTVYGTFAAVPLFLLWVYLSWLIVLAGAELVYALTGFTAMNREQYSDTVLALSVLQLLWKQYQKGHALPEQYLLQKPWLFDQHSLSPERWAALRKKLMSAGLVRVVSHNHYMLGRELGNYRLQDLLQLLGCTAEAETPAEVRLPDWFNRCKAQLDHARQQAADDLNISLTELFAGSAASNAAGHRLKEVGNTST